MFRFLEIISTIFFGFIIALLSKKRKKLGTFTIFLSIILFILSVCSGIIIEAIPMPTDSVRIQATGDRNTLSRGNVIGISKVIVNGKRYSIETSNGDSWYYSKEDEAYLWLDEDDERIIEPIIQEINLKIPVGSDRKLVFLSGNQFGIVKVFYDGKGEIYDLFEEENIEKYVNLPDTNIASVYFIKLCRLVGYNLLILFALTLILRISQSIEKENRLKLIYGLLSIISTLTFFLKTGLTDRTGNGWHVFYDLNHSFSGNFILPIILLPMLYRLFVFCGEIYRNKFYSVRDTLCIALPSGVFSTFMIIGAAFINGKNTLDPIFINKVQIIKSLFALTGYCAIFFFGITWIFDYLDRLDIYRESTKELFKPIQIYLINLNTSPFATTFFTLFLVYLPILIVSYPGILMGDSVHSLQQIYGAYELNNAHPVMYTVLLGLLVKSGEYFFGSANAGIFTYSVFQTVFMIILISSMIKLLATLKISNRITIFLISYYAIYPRIQGWMFLMAKDIISAAFLLAFMVSIYMLVTQKYNIYIYIVLGISDLGAMLFRHDSQYVIVISLFVLSFLIRDFRKQMTIVAAISLSFALIWNNVLLPLANIRSTHPWEPQINAGIFEFIMLQQTARYIRDVGNEVTEEEKEILSACFDYDQIAIVYEPDYKTDNLFGIMRESITQKDWNEYKKIWLKMFFKHPEIYLEATLNHKYQYLYPRLLTTDAYNYTYSLEKMNLVNNSAPELSTKITYPEAFEQLREAYYGLRESFFRYPPVFNILFTTCSFFWIFFIWLAYCICRKNKISIAIMMPLIFIIFVLIAGPMNGRYFRYTYPYAFCLPIVILLGLHSIKQQNIEIR